MKNFRVLLIISVICLVQALFGDSFDKESAIIDSLANLKTVVDTSVGYPKHIFEIGMGFSGTSSFAGAVNKHATALGYEKPYSWDLTVIFSALAKFRFADRYYLCPYLAYHGSLANLTPKEEYWELEEKEMRIKIFQLGLGLEYATEFLSVAEPYKKAHTYIQVIPFLCFPKSDVSEIQAEKDGIGFRTCVGYRAYKPKRNIGWDIGLGGYYSPLKIESEMSSASSCNMGGVFLNFSLFYCNN
jgi:hypothetical protein